MKKLIIILSLGFFPSLLSAQTIVWGVGSTNGVADAEFSLPFTNSTTASFGVSNWTAQTISNSNGTVTPGAAYWTRTANGTSQGGYGMITINSPTAANGAALFDSDFLDNAGTPGAFGTGTAPPSQIGDLVSPKIDLSGYTDSSFVVKFYCNWRSFQVNNFLVSMSVDDGVSWTDVDINTLLPSPANVITEGWVVAPFPTVTQGVPNLNNCRIRFRFDGEYYYALIDDISIETVCIPSTSTITEIACESYTSPSGNYIWTSSNIYTDTIPNAVNCDSIITVNLTILQPNILNQPVSASDLTVCANTGTTITTAGSETDANYYLRNNADNTIIDGPILGTGSGLTFNTGALTANMTYNVYAESVTAGSLNFDGVNDNVILPSSSSFDLNSNITIEFWMKSTQANQWDALVAKGDDSWRVHLHSNGHVGFAGNGGFNEIQSPNSILDGTWHHIAATFDGIIAILYVDGVNVASVSASTASINTSIFDVAIAANLQMANRNFNGDMDEVRIWSIARTSTEINTNMNNELMGTETNLVSYYNFNQGVSGGNNAGVNSLIDLTSNTFNGALNNFSLTTGTTSNWVDGPWVPCPKQMTQTAAVTVLPELTGAHTETVCFGESIVVNGITYDASNLSGTEVFTNIGANNCDSTVTVNLTVLPELTSTHTETVCFGGSIVVNGITYDASNLSGTEVFTNIGANNCDSTVTVNLTVLPELTSTHTETVCFGGSIVVNGITYDANNLTGTEVFTNIGANNCDSTVTVNLTVLPELTGTHTETVCFGESIVVNGSTYDANNLTGTEVFTNIGANNCDSTVTVNLTVLPELTGTHTETVCFGESILVNGITYDASNLSGTEVFTNIGANNCDSTVTVNLTVLPELTGAHTETVCFGESIVVNGITYDASNLSGTEVFTNIGANNCDSTVIVNLTILPELASIHNETVCFGGSIVVNGITYDASNLSGTEVYTNIGANNCDSTVTVNLTVLPELTGTHTETVCFGESIVVNGITYDANNLTGTEVFTNIGANNCDSTVTVNLTIENQIDTTTTTASTTITSNHTSATATYQWIDCGNNQPIAGETNSSYTATANGDYKVTITEGNCTDTSACVAVLGVGIDELSSFGVSIYPNPNNGAFTISTTLPNATYSLFGLDGKLILSNIKIAQSNQTINVENLEDGVYFVTIKNETNQKTVRLVIQK